MRKIELGLGLIGIGKPWGHVPGEVPSEKDALSLLELAFNLGIRLFDTAPSYGGRVSEDRLGKFLGALDPAERSQVTVATKFGEHWNFAGGEPIVDHTFDALRRSLDGSIERLGRIDILQLHKTMPGVLRSDDLARAWEYAASAGIRVFGASVSDPESARMAAEDPCYAYVQLPYNSANPRAGEWIDRAAAAGKRVLVNRPFAMGAMPAGSESFEFILRRNFEGAILTGTKSPAHLKENWAAFQTAYSNCAF